MSLLKLPSQKILAQYLEHCVFTNTSCEDAANESRPGQWRCQVANLNFPVSASVWIQGIVVEILDSNQTVAVDDGTGIIILTQYNSVAVKVDLRKGMYLMAVGALLAVHRHAVIKPLKVQDLSNDDHAETMWPLEVLDQVLFLSSQT
ncbi:hypothetical protein BgiMline_013413 [Biomphalaria glabrata]|uniref:Uncharacterized protein LOC106065056 n=1 Tax=Biomphalaria glabrata TaxID=6526 RepID=A0A2C9KL34_BIOGL|nr:uncharacterized protein LOC106065056 [Biomphalaria glabrata]XP_055885785.1 uncharacterized protein LOC106065056 [Biomphalaria glabrata]KAI8750266.1 recQ-mediated genome instability protein 2 [Biomphalaria glabrata]KAI8787547.1 recQ-mediated genome instability protein 2 [Biomphalaria glabrata]